jgi:tRNA pseudouridine-54 N-methylase
VRVLELDLVDQVDAEVAVHRLVAQDVLVLLGGAGHLVLAAQREDLREADVEEQAFHQAGEHDQALEQRLVVLGRAGDEVRVGQRVDERDQELVLVADRLDLV